MNVRYRRSDSRKWEDAIALEFYDGWNQFFVLRWSDWLQDFEGVLVPASRIYIPA